MNQFARVFAAVGVAAVSITCADQSIGPRKGGLALLPIAPVFVTSPAGGPRIDIARVRGILKREQAADSSVAEALVRGDSAVLEFLRVVVTGDSTPYKLTVQAIDANDVVVFKGSETIQVSAGENAPASPVLEYNAPDASVASIEVLASGQAVELISLDWAGAEPSNTSCLSRAPSTAAITQMQLSASGATSQNVGVPGVRVGWTSRDTSVATVDESGLVKARCSNRYTYIVARTFLDVADSVKVDVTAQPFTLLMEPEIAELPRGDTLQLRALLVDENGNPVTTSSVNWFTSDSSRATVSGTGQVVAISNGRVVVTASSGDRSTVGIVQVVPPKAAVVQIAPEIDTLAIGQSRVYRGTAIDRNGQVIGDASGYAWESTNTAVVRVNSSGAVTAMGTGDAMVIVAIDERKDTANVHVRVATDGAVSGFVMNAASGLPIGGASVSRAGGPSAVSDQAGEFTLAGLSPGDELTILADAYVEVIYHNVPVLLGQTVNLGDIPLAPFDQVNGSLTAVIVNALDDAPVPNALVTLFPGLNPPSADPATGVTTPAAVAEGVTDAQGLFAFPSIPPGTYTLAVGGDGYSATRKVAVSVGAASRTVRIPLSPLVTGDPGALRVVLSWGDCAANQAVPCDLDAHATGPASAPDEGRFHVAYFSDLYLRGSDTVAVLDNDATEGVGPETITLRPREAGIYKYYVHNYTDGSDTTGGMDTSSTRLSTTAQARVDVYRGANLVATFFPPSGQPGTLWNVFQYDGTTLTPVNEMIRVQDFPVVPGDFLRMPDPERDEQRRILQDWTRRPK